VISVDAESQTAESQTAGSRSVFAVTATGNGGRTTIRPSEGVPHMAAADAVTLIERDHRALESLFERVRSGTGDRVTLLNEIAVRLTAHARAEEQEVYPALGPAAAAEPAPDRHSEVEHAFDEHHEAEHWLRAARNLTGSPHFDEAFAVFVAAVGHHVQEEEQEMLPALRKAVDPAALRTLGAAFEQARQALVAELEPLAGPPGTVNLAAAPAWRATHRARAARVGRSPKRPPARAAQPAAAATRDELYELARAADIPGRSGMTKEELAAALRRKR
jgi:hypothetical protein